jgi:lycopene cyclase domain-containing protein
LFTFGVLFIYNSMNFTLQHSTYLLLMLGSLLIPLIFSFEKQIHFVSKWKYLPLAIGLPGVLFIAWDVWFTRTGVWSFSDDFTLGLRLLDLPLEEWLFFIVVPFCSLFIYEVVKFFFHKFSYHERIVKTLWFVAVILFLFAVVSKQHSYTFWNLTFTTIFLVFLLFNSWFYQHITHFIIALFVAFIPMLIVNGILTSFPVVIYNPEEFSTLRLFTIPLEDFVYFFLLFAMNTYFYELQSLKSKRKSTS